MKTRYDKSKIMKLAHQLMKRDGYSRSLALTLAWDRARRSEFYWIVTVSKPNNTKIDYNNPVVQQSLVDYYNRPSGSYYGD